MQKTISPADFLTPRFIGFAALWGSFLLYTIGFLRHAYSVPFFFAVGAACLIASVKEADLRRVLLGQRWVILIVVATVFFAGVGAFLTGGGTYVILRSAFILGAAVGTALLLSVYCILYIREGKEFYVLLSLLGYFALILLWTLFVIRVFGMDSLVRVGEGGAVERAHGAIGREDLAMFGLFRIGNMLNYFYFAAPCVALLGLVAFRNAWWLKIGAVGCALILGYVVVAFAARGPVIIAGAVGVLFFFLLLRRHLFLAVASLVTFAVAGYFTVRVVDPLLLHNLLVRFETIGHDGRIVLITTGFNALISGPFSAAGTFIEGYYAHNLIIDYGLQYNILVAMALTVLLCLNFFVSFRWCMSFLRGRAERFVLVPLGINLGSVLTVMIFPNLFPVLGMWVLSLGLLQGLWSMRTGGALARGFARRSAMPRHGGRSWMPPVPAHAVGGFSRMGRTPSAR